MAINRPRIASQPAIERKRFDLQPVKTAPVAPGGSYDYLDSAGSVQTETIGPPDYAGDVFVHITTGTNPEADMYVGVDVGGSLRWVKADFTKFMNGFTGYPIDPIFDR